MVTLVTGDLFASEAQTLVNAVNGVGPILYDALSRLAIPVELYPPAK